MRVLHLVHQYLPEHIGGTELYTKWLTKGLSQQGYQISIFHRRSAEGVGVEHCSKNGRQIWAAWSGIVTPIRRFRATFGDPPIARTFERVLEETQPELVHIQHLMGYPVALIQAIQQRGIPYVMTLWDFWWVCANAQLLTNYSQEVCAGPRMYLNCAHCALARAGHSQLWPVLPVVAGPLLWRNWLLRRIMAGASRLIAPTKFVHNWYSAHGAPAEKLITVPPGLDQPPSIFKRPSLPNVPLRFGYVGGLSWQKGVHVLIEAFNGAKKGAELWIAGDEKVDPTYAAHLYALASANVRFLGKLTRVEVWETLAKVDVLVVPSMWYETFAFVVSEAFAAGVPVVASQLGPLADRVRDGVDGLLVPPGDVKALQNALLRFLQDPTLLPRLRAGIRPVRTIEDHVKDIEVVYQAVSSNSNNNSSASAISDQPASSVIGP
jgi:glycosyltransferase involved in cell wall biosynthesis